MRCSSSLLIVLLMATWAWFGWSNACSGQCEARCPGPIGIYDVPCDPCCCDPRWTFTGEGIALQRSTTRSQALFLSGPSPTSNVLLDSQDMDFPVAFGFQVGAIRHDVCSSGWDLEVAYFQVDGFATEAFLPDHSYMVTDITGGFLEVADATARYTSALYSGELNARHPCTDWLTLLAGFRMVELDEHYQAVATGVKTPVPVTLNVNAYNHLYGFQLGADAEVYNMGGPVQINALCKAGIYDNFARQNIRRVETGFTDESLSARRDQATFLGEAAVVATCALTKRLAFRASYGAMWLVDVALAPEQLSTTNFATSTATVNTSGGVFYHGGGLGFEYRF